MTMRKISPDEIIREEIDDNLSLVFNFKPKKMAYLGHVRFTINWSLYRNGEKKHEGSTPCSYDLGKNELIINEIIEKRTQYYKSNIDQFL